MDVLFIDTNAIRNNGGKKFFGNIEMFEKIANQIQILIPSIVIDEIKQQKIKRLRSTYDSFKDNFFTNALKIQTGPFFMDLIDDIVQDLFNNSQSEIPHKIVDYDLSGRLGEMRLQAIGNLAPFEKKDDKGFKDAYIYFTILEYQKDNPNDEIYLITNDGRLSEAFNINETVNVITEVDEYYDLQRDYFGAEYFMGRVREELELENDVTIKLLDVDVSEDDDWLIDMEIDGTECRIIADFYSKEIIDNDY